MFSLAVGLILAAPPVSPVTTAAYSPDGKLLAAGSRGEVHLFDAASGDRIATVATPPGRVTAIAFATPTFWLCAVGEPGKSGIIVVHDRDKRVREWTAHSDSIYGLAVTPDGKTVFSAGYDRVVKKWTLADGGTPTAVAMKDHSDAVYALAMHPTGKLLASASADRTVKVWDVATGQRLYSLGDSTDWLATVAWSPDGTRLAAAGTDRSVRIWKADATGGTLEKSSFAHGGPVVALAYSPDGKSLHTVGDDRLIKKFATATLTEQFTTPPLPDAIHALAVRPDGQRFVVGRFDGGLLEYDAASGKPTPAPRLLPYTPRPPKLALASPAFVKRMPTIELTLRGTGLETATAVKAMPALPATIRAKSSTSLTVTLDAKAASLGPVSLTVESPLGPSNGVTVALEAFDSIAETGRTDSLSSAMTIPLDRVVAGVLDRAGDADFVRFEAKAGQEIGMTVAAAKFSPLLSVHGPAGELLGESAAGAYGFVAPKDGAYTVGVRDRDFRGGGDFAYRLAVGRLPVVTTVFPPVVARGTTTTVHVAGVHLPTREPLTVTVTADEKAMTKDLVPLLGEPRPAGTATVRIDDLPAIVANGREAVLPKANGAADGLLAKPGDELVVAFRAKTGERLIVEGLARRFGSPVDPQIEIRDSSGKPVPRATLRCVARTNLTFRDHDSVKPGLRLETWNELAANDLLLIDAEIVKIQQLPGHPDADCDFFDVNGIRSAFFDTTPAHHAKDSPMYKIELHPPGANFPPNGMPVVRLDYRNDDGGPGYGKDARLFFTAPADGDYRVRLTDARGAGGPEHIVRVTVRPPKPDVKVKVAPAKPSVWAGGAVPITVSVDRLDGEDGPVDVKLTNLPEGFSSPPGRIEAGFVSTTLVLHAAAAAKAGSKPMTLVATTADGRSREIAVPAPTVDAKPEMTVALDTAKLTIIPGKEVRFTVKITRADGFRNRVPIEVRGLPHGVAVQNIGLNKIMITEKETEREVVLRAEPWVDAVTLPIAVVALREGRTIPYAAPALGLTVGGK
jgi:hypothetical protein